MHLSNNYINNRLHIIIQIAQMATDTSDSASASSTMQLHNAVANQVDQQEEEEQQQQQQQPDVCKYAAANDPPKPTPTPRTSSSQQVPTSDAEAQVVESRSDECAAAVDNDGHELVDGVAHVVPLPKPRQVQQQQEQQPEVACVAQREADNVKPNSLASASVNQARGRPAAPTIQQPDSTAVAPASSHVRDLISRFNRQR